MLQVDPPRSINACGRPSHHLAGLNGKGTIRHLPTSRYPEDDDLSPKEITSPTMSNLPPPLYSNIEGASGSLEAETLNIKKSLPSSTALATSQASALVGNILSCGQWLSTRPKHPMPIRNQTPHQHPSLPICPVFLQLPGTLQPQSLQVLAIPAIPGSFTTISLERCSSDDD